MTDKHQRNSEQLCELLPWYVSGTLDDAEFGAMEQHLHHCPQCSEELPVLRAVQKSVHNESLTVLAPKPNAEQFLAMVRQRNLLPHTNRVAWVAGAIAAGVALFALVLNFMPIHRSATMPTIYRTVTGTESGATFDYVLLISFDRQAGSGARDEALRALTPVSVAGPDSDGRYRVVVRLPAHSIDELDNFRRSVESDTAISSAAVVAVELPVEAR